jgi:hypothetical protein
MGLAFLNNQKWRCVLVEEGVSRPLLLDLCNQPVIADFHPFIGLVEESGKALGSLIGLPPV